MIKIESNYGGKTSVTLQSLYDLFSKKKFFDSKITSFISYLPFISKIEIKFEYWGDSYIHLTFKNDETLIIKSNKLSNKIYEKYLDKKFNL